MEIRLKRLIIGLGLAAATALALFVLLPKGREAEAGKDQRLFAVGVFAVCGKHWVAGDSPNKIRKVSLAEANAQWIGPDSTTWSPQVTITEEGKGMHVAVTFVNPRAKFTRRFEPLPWEK